MNKIKIRKDIIYDKRISDLSFATYMFLQYNCKKQDVGQIINPIIILSGLLNTPSIPYQRQRENIKDSITELNEVFNWNISELGSKFNWFVPTQSIYLDTLITKYATVDMEAVRTILNKGGKYKKYKLLRYYALLMDSISKRITVNYFDIDKKNILICEDVLEDLSKKLNIDVKTACTYNQFLEKHHLIYICKSYKPNNWSKNIYGFYGDRDYIEIYAKHKNKLIK